MPLPYLAAFRKRYLEVSAAIWLWLDNVLSVFSDKNKGKFADGLSDTQVKTLWEGIEANLPDGITAADARSIMDPDDVKCMRILAPVQHQGSNMQKRLADMKKPSYGKPIHPAHGKWFISYYVSI